MGHGQDMQPMVNGPKDCAWNKAGLSLVSTAEEVPLSSAGNGLWLGQGPELPASHRQVLRGTRILTLPPFPLPCIPMGE